MAEGGIRVDIEWSCPTCTYINKADSFKCSVCGTLKGTATRQVKYHLSTLEQQYMSETLQSNRIQTARALSKLQAAQSQSSSSSSSSLVSSPPHLISAAPVSSPAISIPHSPSVQDSMGHSSQTNRLTVGHTANYTRHSAGIGSIKKKQRMRASTGPSNHRLKSHKWPRLKNIDRSHVIRSQNITVNNVTVTITEYPLLYPDSE